ncbi:hypothetical protein ACFWNK_36125 [Streptomyces sp. NPDC058417]|uniref:hypothetical protein n=1 Tax=unclassified Streptomyces TaxID=2593676 RepID=UPI00366888CD
MTATTRTAASAARSLRSQVRALVATYRGVAFVVPAAALLSAAGGGITSTLRSVAPVVACALPIALLVADWWRGRPGTALAAALRIHPGAVNLIVVLAAAVAVHRVSAALLPGRTAAPAIAFVVFVEITVVSEHRPFHRIPATPGAVCALAAAWSVAALVTGSGLGADDGLLALTVTIGAVQILLMAVLDGALKGWITPSGRRIAVANGLCLGAGTTAWLGGTRFVDPVNWTALMAALTGAAVTACWVPAPGGGPAGGRVHARRFTVTAVLTTAGVLAVSIACRHLHAAGQELLIRWSAYLGLGAVGFAVVSYSMLFAWWWPSAAEPASAERGKPRHPTGRHTPPAG